MKIKHPCSESGFLYAHRHLFSTIGVSKHVKTYRCYHLCLRLLRQEKASVYVEREALLIYTFRVNTGIKRNDGSNKSLTSVDLLLAAPRVPPQTRRFLLIILYLVQEVLFLVFKRYPGIPELTEE